MENLNYLLESLMFVSSFQDLIYSTLFYALWIIITVLLLFVGIKFAFAGLILIPIITYVLYPDTMSLILGKSIYFFLFDLILLKLLLIPLNKKLPPNNEIVLSRFQLSKEQLIDFKKMAKQFKEIENEENNINALDIDRRADGKYSERSKKGKEANARLEQLKKAKFGLWLKKAEYMDKQNKFSSFRFAKNIFDKSVLNSIVLSIIFTVITVFFVSKEIAIYYGYINLLLFVMFSIILFFIFISKFEKQEEELYDTVYDYYLNSKIG